MAIYHCSTKTIGRTSGRSAVAASAYRSGSELHDERTETTHDFTKRAVWLILKLYRILRTDRP